MTQEELKRAVAKAAVEYTLNNLDFDSYLGVGTGSTCDYFIDLLAEHKGRIAGAVASSEHSAQRLREHGIPVHDLNSVDEVQLYIDGADEVNLRLELIKGGGGALTREKIVASVAKKFICIVDHKKHVQNLGRFPLAIEVIPMARSHVAKAILKLGGEPVYRENFVTDNGNIILDIHRLHPMGSASALEQELNNMAGVVCNGIFAKRPADLLLSASPQGGVESFTAQAN